ncbi:MAG: transcriptional regulator NrdR [Armatimonadota bacterium]|nr:transcriptional regulator NrdR [Armatimonadota bacterium]
MRCPNCGQSDTRVIDSRPAEEGTLLRRRRLCDHCGTRFTTHERILQTPLVVVKKDGRREEFSQEKLYSGIAKACNKRSVPTDAITRLVEDIESTLRQEAGTEVESGHIGELVMEQLYHLDQVAYVRFASVYQRFDDVRRFAQLLERMSRRARAGSSARGVKSRNNGSSQNSA